jgi:hypothetical protein
VPNFYKAINGQVDRKKTIIGSFIYEFEKTRDKIRYKDLRDTDYCVIVEERDVPNIFFKIRSHKSGGFSNIVTIKGYSITPRSNSKFFDLYFDVIETHDFFFEREFKNMAICMGLIFYKQKKICNDLCKIMSKFGEFNYSIQTKDDSGTYKYILLKPHDSIRGDILLKKIKKCIMLYVYGILDTFPESKIERRSEGCIYIFPSLYSCFKIMVT